MSEFIGKQIEVGLAIEGTRNTGETVADKWLKKVKADIMVKSEKVTDDSTFGKLESGEGGRTIKTWYEGTLEGIIHADAIGYLLQNIYGASTPSGSSGAYSHAFTLDQTIEHDTLTIFNHDSAVSKKALAGGMISSLEISASVDDYVRFKAEVSALSSATSSDTPSYDDEVDFIGKDITIEIADTEAELSSSPTVLKAKNVTVTYDTGLIRDHVFGAVAPNNQFNANMSIEIDLTLNYTDTTFEDLYKTDDYKYMQIEIANDGNEGITFLFNKVQVIEWSKSGDADKLVTQEVKLKAFYNADDDAQSEVTLENNVASY